MDMVKKVKAKRKAIFVNDEVFNKFKKRAKKEDRTYSSMLDRLLLE